jgi:molybdopterin/thiamine biosynthesis adenylyltransferase
METRFSRQSFLGAEASSIFSECTIGVVGLGGGGSHIAQQLAYLGIGRFLLYDGDKAESTNMNRLIGASFEDARQGTLKVEIAARSIAAVNPEARVHRYPCVWQEAPKTIREADIIVSCVDSYSARQDLEVTARRFLIPLVDIGMDVFLVDNNPHIAGQAILSVPDGPCMRCLGFLNDENLRREAEQYGAAGGRPQVVWSNGVLASIAVGIVASLLTGWNDPLSNGEYLHFDGNTNRVWRSPRLEYAPKRCSHFPEDFVGEPTFG